MQQIKIRHLSGSKANQEEIFPFDKFSKLTIGRDPSSEIAYSPDIDDLVSRRHSEIGKEPGNEGKFKVTDLNSRNGTFVNQVKVHGSTTITHGDIIQLGKNGPEFVFELEPPPPEILKATRLAELPPEMLAKTRESVMQPPPTVETLITPPFNVEGAATNSTHSTSNRRPVGRETVERLILTTKSESRKYLINSVAAMLGIIAVVAAFFVYKDVMVRENAAQAEKQLAETRAAITKTDTDVKSIQAKMTPRQIADQYSASTVLIEVSWKLIDTLNGKQVYYRYNKEKPLYVQLSDGTIEPWLITDDEKGRNKAIGENGHRGSGFVVFDSGFILTNRHVAATWLTREILPLPGDLYTYTTPRKRIGEVRDYVGDLDKWVPAKSKQLEGRIAGHLDKLDVTFPKSSLRLPAKLVRTSNEHDAALIKIDTPQAVKAVEIYDNYDEIRAGDAITILGYPGISPSIWVQTKSQDPFNPAPDIAIVPDPTVTPGVIGKVIRGKLKPIGGEVYDYYSESDSYQLTATATGAGNSGGPVFDEYGRVIGIFYAGASRDHDARITFSVPIKFGKDLMEVSPVLD